MREPARSIVQHVRRPSGDIAQMVDERVGAFVPEQHLKDALAAIDVALSADDIAELETPY
ncbi:MAG: hypothetical protein O3C28_16400 [Proteobacteria bacterium]|nr:hypothetical protein [Pseudomonadota bacterium]